jgi:hypothetical protein
LCSSAASGVAVCLTLVLNYNFGCTLSSGVLTAAQELY